MAWEREALLLAFLEGGDSTLEAMATTFGYKKEKPKDNTKNPGKSGSQKDEFLTPPKDEVAAEIRRNPTRFLRVVSRSTNPETISERPAYLNDRNLQLEAEPGTYIFEAPEELVAFSRLSPLLLNALGQQRRNSRLDTRALTRQLAKQQALKKVPYLSSKRWPQRLQVIVDTSMSVRPYWKDFANIAQALTRLLGNSAVDVIRFDEDTLESDYPHCVRWPQQAGDEWRYWQVPAADVSILFLGDAGVLGSSRRGEIIWRRFSEKLLSHPASMLALSPASRSPKDQRWIKAFRPTPLSDKPTVIRKASPRGFSVTACTDSTIEEVLTALSAVPVTDIGLLRKLRRELSWGSSELEGVIWNHPKTSVDSLGVLVAPEYSGHYHARFKKYWKGTVKVQMLWKVVEEHHKGAYVGQKKLQALYKAVLEDKEDASVRNYYKGLLATSNQYGAGVTNESVLKQCQTTLDFVPKSFWQGPYKDIAHQLFGAIKADVIKEGQWPKNLPKGFNPGHYQWMQPSNQTESWYILQCGVDGFVRFSKADNNENLSPNAIVLDIPENMPLTISSNQGDSSVRQISDEQVVQIADGEQLLVNTALEQLVLDAAKKPGWASGVGMSASGLWATLPWRDSHRLVRWQAGTHEQPGEWEVNENKDQHGLHTDLTLFNTQQRFRWIKPGTFLMGSPDTEPERYTDETQHSVTITQGYWMADTLVTQELWLAVMGDNPSYFHDSLEQPVDSVSWDDCMRFIAKLNQQYAGINARLPTEAEWEYACRAGTQSPFSFGDSIRSKQVNFDGNEPYNNGPKSQYREKTVAVKSLPENPWGLYEMHGNVWEWCSDWFGPHQKGAERDPKEASKGFDGVLRGGSWIYNGRRARSANRSRRTADHRINRIGFRLVLGPGAQAGGALVSGATLLEDTGERHEQTRRDERQSGPKLQEKFQK